LSIYRLREGLRVWLNRQTRIDVWDIDVPRNVPTVIDGVRYPANTAIEMPVKDFGLTRRESYVEGEGRFVYGLLYRFSHKAAKHQLPVSSVENLVNYLCEYAISNPDDIYEDILGIAVDNVANPVAIARVEGEDQDWLIIGRVELSITFVSSARILMDGDDTPLANGFGTLQPPGRIPEPTTVNIHEIRTGLFRSRLPVTPGDPSSFVKDQDIVLDMGWEGLGETGNFSDGDSVLIQD
jgi:hypothetical protein